MSDQTTRWPWNAWAGCAFGLALTVAARIASGRPGHDDLWPGFVIIFACAAAAALWRRGERPEHP